jgi:hypothetical protein
VGRWSGFEQTLLGLVHLHACAAATLDGNTAALALHTLLPPLHSPLHFLSVASSSEPAGGLTAATWDVFGRGQDAVRASEARIGVTCTGRALQSACSIFLQGLTGRGAFCWPPFAALLVSVANLLLALTGMLEGVREWGRALSVCSLFSVLCSRLSASHCRRFAPATPPRQARSGCQICTGNNTSSLLGLGPWGSRRSSLSGGCSRTIPINLAGVCNCTRPTSPGISPAFKHTTKEFCRYLQPSFLHSRAVLRCSSSLLRAKETLCRFGKTASRHSSAAGQAGHPICRRCNVNSSNCRTLSWPCLASLPCPAAPTLTPCARFKS